jgi:hypothetical protein
VDLGRGFAQRIFALFILRDIEKKPRVFESRAVSIPSLDNVFE